MLTSWSIYSDFLPRLSSVTSRPRVCLHLFPPCVLLPLLLLDSISPISVTQCVLPNTQFADRKGLGPYDAHLCVPLKRGKEASVVEIDFSSAFDKVNH